MCLTRNALRTSRLEWAGLVLAGLGVVAALAIIVTFHAAGNPAETSAKPPPENSAEPAAETSKERPNEKPGDKPTEKPAEKGIERHADKSVETSAQHSAGKLIEKQVEKPVDRSAAEPVGKPADKLAGRIGTASAELHRNSAAADVWSKPKEDVTQQLERWEQLGRTVLESGTEAEFQQYQKDRMETLPIGGLISPSLVNERLRLLYAERRWDELGRFEKQLNQPLAGHLPLKANPKRFAKQAIPLPPHYVADNPQLFAWMYERIVGRSAQNSAPLADLRQPLIVPVSRAASGLFQQLRAALEDKQYEEAAGLLTSSYALRNEGLIATPGDEQLLVSYRGMQLILLRRRELAEAMGGRLDDAARLRIQQTFSQGDPAAVEALTIQYYGTPAHASACQWLGDRKLVGTDFTQALAWYDEGRLTASPEQQADLAARVRLAAAMLGDLRGEPPVKPVSFGENHFPPEQFERRVRDAVAQRAKAPTASPADAFPVLSVPQPVQFDFAEWGVSDAGGNRDPLSARITGTAHDDLLIVSHRQRTVALDSASGKARWSWEQGDSDLPDPICPLLQGRRIYLRTTTVSGRYGVVCLDEKTGRVLWRRDCGDNVAGDPQLVQGRLYVLTFGEPTGSRRMFTSPLYFVELNAENGEVLSRSHFADASREGEGKVATHVDRRPEYQSICIGNRLIVLFSGSVLCLDLQGRVQWLRTSAVIPEEIDPVSHFRPCQPPRESAGRLYLQQPGSCTVECLAAQTGELVWRRGVVGLLQILDLLTPAGKRITEPGNDPSRGSNNDELLLVRSAYGLTALQAATGRVLWRKELPGMLGAVARNAPGQIFCTRQIVQGGQSQLALLWIDAATGETKAHSLLPCAGRNALTLGPIIASGDRAWCCQGGRTEAKPKPGGNGISISVMLPTGPAVEGDLP